MKLFPMGLVPEAQALRKTLKHYAQTKPLLSKVLLKICQGDLLKATALKRSAKGAMNSSFRNAPCSKPSRRKTTTEM